MRDLDGGAWSALDGESSVFPVRDERQGFDSTDFRSSLPHGLAAGATRWLDWSRSDDVFVDLVKLADILLLALAGVCACWVHDLRRAGGGDIVEYLVVSALAGFAALAYLASRGMYTRAALNEIWRQLPNIAVAVLVGLAVWASYAFATKISGDFSRVAVAAWVALGFVFLAGARTIIVWRSRAWARQGRSLRRVAIVGANEFCGRVAARMRTKADARTEIVGIYDDESAGDAACVPVQGTVRDLSAYLRTNVVHSIIICLPLWERERIKQAVGELHGAVADIQLAVDIDGLVGPVGRGGDTGDNCMVTLSERPFKGWKAVRKMLFDRVAGGALLLLASPVLLVIAILIKLDSRGPVLFRQPRRGFNDGVFTLYKFRTMFAHDIDVMGERLTEREDARITQIGRHLRRFSLDELPQLWNVVLGNMSLVGPRPHALNAKAADRLYAEVVAGYARRHRVKPGITGWAQINGWRGETTTEAQITNRVSHDLYYIENWSLALDLKILAITLLREFNSRHAY